MLNLISRFFWMKLAKTLLLGKLTLNFLRNIIIGFFRKNLLGIVIIYYINLITNNKWGMLLKILIAVIRIFRISMMQLLVRWLLCEATLLKLCFINFLDFIVNYSWCHFIWLKIRWIIWINTWTYNITFFYFFILTFIQIIFICLCYFLYKR